MYSNPFGLCNKKKKWDTDILIKLFLYLKRENNQPYQKIQASFIFNFTMISN